MFLVIVDIPSPECGHNIVEFDTLEEAQKFVNDSRNEFSNGDYYDTAKISLCVVLDSEEWECVGK